MYRIFIKRLLDLILAFVSLVITLPIFLVITIVLWIQNDGKPFFFQERPGKNAAVFKVIKFKTMNDHLDSKGVLLPDHQRTTGFGKFLRQTSLDEIPQLINVLVGNMSLIGPRPLLMEYLDLYSTEQHRRHLVRPGITGLSQVNGRNLLEWKKRFEMDVHYVDNLSFLLDFKIFLLTILKVFKREGASSSKTVTVEKFKGNYL
ncbi:sugar transferase [Algoriphagus ratkowskyi]|uniref:Sugar transferase n=1 Tax=Algoriphagus ratkowskyi TaxID=57028 RepID=A0ABY3HS08_9BACT|nr:sugar transferase [Algoriphagus ratkowskyi]